MDKAVCKLPGVTEVNVNLLAGSMTVAGDDSVTPSAVIDAVQKAGYGAALANAPKAASAAPAADPMAGELQNMKRRFWASLCFLLP